MKKKIFVLFILAGLLLPIVALPASAGAVNVFQACNPNSNSNNGAGAGSSDVCQEQQAAAGKNPIIDTLKVVLEILAIIIGVASVIMIIIGGIRIIMSGGDPSSVKSGRDTVIYALIGVVVALFAQAIVTFVLGRLQ